MPHFTPSLNGSIDRDELLDWVLSSQNGILIPRRLFRVMHALTCMPRVRFVCTITVLSVNTSYPVASFTEQCRPSETRALKCLQCYTSSLLAAYVARPRDTTNRLVWICRCRLLPSLCSLLQHASWMRTRQRPTCLRSLASFKKKLAITELCDILARQLPYEGEGGRRRSCSRFNRLPSTRHSTRFELIVSVFVPKSDSTANRQATNRNKEAFVGYWVQDVEKLGKGKTNNTQGLRKKVEKNYRKLDSGLSDTSKTRHRKKKDYKDNKGMLHNLPGFFAVCRRSCWRQASH